MRNDRQTARPIDANALREAAETCRETTEAFQELIDAQPTLGAAQERTTRMLRKYSRPNVFADLWLHCEACGGVVNDNWRYKYCPECGARVKEQEGYEPIEEA